MGNKQFEGGTLSIVFKHNFSIPGELVEGEAVVELKEPYNGKKLMFTIWGEERYFEEGLDDDSDTEYKNELLSFSMTVPLQVQGTLQPGTHRFPFNFKLQSGIPSSTFLINK